MKLVISFLIVMLSGLTGLAQSNVINTEIEISYVYHSEFDSVPLDKLVMTYDSLNHLETWEAYIYDSISVKWIMDHGIMWDRDYDSQGKLSGIEVYLWNPDSNGWLAEFRGIYNFDSTGNIIEGIDYVWDSASGNWIYDQKSVYEYNQDGFKILQHEYLWNSDLETWINSQKTEYTPDEQGEDLAYIESEWNSDSAVWINKNRYEGAYDSTGNRVYWGTFGWDPDSVAWRIQARVCTTWTVDGRISLIYSWDYHPYDFYLDEPWIMKIVYTYDTIENTCVELHCLTQDGDTTNWNCVRVEYTYDEHGREISFVSYFSDSSIYARSETGYDSFGNIIMHNEYRYDTSGIVIKKEENEYHFDENGNKIMDIHYTWDLNNNPLGLLKKTFYYRYSAPEAVERIQPDLNIVLYPNPASDWLFISGDVEAINIEIYDLSGRRYIVSNEKQINLSGLEQGVYLVRLINQEGYTIDTRKIIKK